MGYGIFVDVFMLIVIGTGIYFGLKSTVMSELFKLFGVFLATFITLHYYGALGQILEGLPVVPDGLEPILAFCLLFLLITTVFVMLLEGWLLILKIEFASKVEQWGGLAISLIRTYLICGIIYVGLLVVGHQTLMDAARHSISRVLFQNTSVGIYKNFYFGLVKPFFPKEKLNKNVLQLVDPEDESAKDIEE